MGHGSKIQVSRQIQYDGSTALAQSAVRRMMVNHTSGTMMTEPNLEVPAELRELAEKTIDQAERAFDLFFDAARRSSSTAPIPVQELSKLVLAFWEESLKTSFEYARKLALTSSYRKRQMFRRSLSSSRLAVRSDIFWAQRGQALWRLFSLLSGWDPTVNLHR